MRYNHVYRWTKKELNKIINKDQLISFPEEDWFDYCPHKIEKNKIIISSYGEEFVYFSEKKYLKRINIKFTKL